MTLTVVCLFVLLDHQIVAYYNNLHNISSAKTLPAFAITQFSLPFYSYSRKKKTNKRSFTSCSYLDNFIAWSIKMHLHLMISTNLLAPLLIQTGSVPLGVSSRMPPVIKAERCASKDSFIRKKDDGGSMARNTQKWKIKIVLVIYSYLYN